MMDMRPKYKMRFVGYDANGELKPTAPAYKQHEIRELPLEYAQNFWWELVDAVPDLVIPEPRYEDSVFIEETFVPFSDITHDDSDHMVKRFVDSLTEEEPPADTADVGETLTVKVYPETAVDEPLILSDFGASGRLIVDLTVKDLKDLIEKHGGEVDSKWRKADLIREAQKLLNPT